MKQASVIVHSDAIEQTVQQEPNSLSALVLEHIFNHVRSVTETNNIYFLNQNKSTRNSDSVFAEFLSLDNVRVLRATEPSYMIQYMKTKKKIIDAGIDDVTVMGAYADACVESCAAVLSGVYASQSTFREGIIKSAMPRWNLSAIKEVLETPLHTKIFYKGSLHSSGTLTQDL